MRHQLKNAINYQISFKKINFQKIKFLLYKRKNNYHSIKTENNLSLIYKKFTFNITIKMRNLLLMLTQQKGQVYKIIKTTVKSNTDIRT